MGVGCALVSFLLITFWYSVIGESTEEVINLLNKPHQIPFRSLGSDLFKQWRSKRQNEEKSSYTQFDSNTKLETNKDKKKVIKIGHLGAIGQFTIRLYRNICLLSPHPFSMIFINMYFRPYKYKFI
uniref:Uncharacterized protein n=1 Tax=Heterorhabditis bacteriophora TaxID=37862 RepID=A0A1I7XH88_HETBA